MKTKKYIIENIFFFVGLCGFTLQIWITVYLTGIDTSYFDHLKDNWTRSVIQYRIYDKETDETSCKNNQQTFLIGVKWKGTVAGGVNYFNESIRMPGENYGQYSIPAINDFTIDKWNNTVICMNKTFRGTYFEEEFILKTCQETQKDCGIIDTKKNHLCYPKDKDCPKPVREIIDGGINNETDNTIYVNFWISENQPCWDKKYANIKKEKLHIWDYYYERNECKDGEVDNNFVKIAKYNKKAFLTENNILQILQNNIPDYKTPGDEEEIYWYGKPYVGWDLVCRKKYSNFLIRDFNDTTNRINKSINWNIASWLIFFVFILLLVIKYFVLTTKFVWYKEETPSYVKPVLMICSILNFIIGCVLYSTISGIGGEMYSLFGESDCADENSMKMWGRSAVILERTKYANLISLFVHFLLASQYGIRTAIKYSN